MNNFTKKIIALMAVTVFLQALGGISPPAWGRNLEDHKKEGLLKEINQLCWDTWCEGNFILNFNSLSCDWDKFTCVLDIEYAQWQDKTGSFEVKCTVLAPSAKRVLAHSYSFKPSDHFYDQISRCIDFYEAQAWDYYQNQFEPRFEITQPKEEL